MDYQKYRDYVTTHDDRIAETWEEMLFEVDKFGQEYTDSDFAEAALDEELHSWD